MDFFLEMCFIIAVVWICVNECFSKPKENKEKAAADRLKKDDWRQDNNILTSVEYKFNNGSNTISCEYLIDKQKQNLILSDTSTSYTIIPFSEIIGCEILINSQNSGGVGRAIAGGILAGGTGAIVGATTAKNKISSYKVAIYMNNLDQPQFIFTLIEAKDYSILDVPMAREFSQNVVASIKAIIAKSVKNEFGEQLNKTNDFTNTIQDNSDEKPQGNTEKERLLKLKDLLDNNLIAEDEYNKKVSEIVKLL